MRAGSPPIAWRVLPGEALPHVEACLERLASSDYRADLVLYLGPGLYLEQRDRLRPRYRAIAEGIVAYQRRLGDPGEPPEELAVPEVDRFWEILRGMRSEDGPECEEMGCHEPRVRVAVFCHRHYYERIERKPPPDY